MLKERSTNFFRVNPEEYNMDYVLTLVGFVWIFLFQYISDYLEYVTSALRNQDEVLVR
jgi:hypothetical protein